MDRNCPGMALFLRIAWRQEQVAGGFIKPPLIKYLLSHIFREML